ncbi:MAG: helix-turn-helix domain-containing protein [Myxococcales bacterium]|nr:helix-turn-helix domain-containing protein [Myxococcales bacterium]MDD9972082.1 helix-turn-helix domain-containing protein [Myxococcales bacterium]
MSSSALHIPTSKTSAQAQEALQVLRGLPRRRGPRHLRVEGKSGQAVDATVPREAFDLFLEVLGQLANGHAVTIVPVHAELTTQQAADLLNLSRPYLIRLLDQGEIAYTKVGTHRRIRAEDVMAYKAKRDAEHEEVLDELAAEAQELGLGY